MAESSTSSVESKFRFVSYKIDDFKFEMIKNISVLSYNGNINQDKTEINLRIKPPTFFKKNNIYVGGIDCKIGLISDDSSVFNLSVSISGMFQSENELQEDVKNSLVKYQIPTILFPYLRSTITTFIANSGFGTFIFPLINVVELSQKTLKDVQINIVE
jgi:preprotein translocase subunit SecB